MSLSNLPETTVIDGIANVWGEIEPGRVFYEEIVSAGNQELIDGDGSERKLSDTQLKKLKLEIRKLELAINDWECRTYEQRIEHIKKKMQRYSMNISEFKAQIQEQRAHLKSLVNNPPQPIVLGWRESLQLKMNAVDVPRIRTRRQIQIARLRLARFRDRLEEHQMSLRNEELYDRLAKDMQMEVGYFADILRNTWMALGYGEKWYKKGKLFKRGVKFELAYYTPDEIQYKVWVSDRNLLGAVRHLMPEGVTAWDLVKPQTLAELSAACRRPVSSPNQAATSEEFENGCWVTVHRANLTEGLFDKVAYSNVMGQYARERRLDFPVPIGVKRGRAVEWLRLSKHPHMIFTGITGSGKTNAIRVFISTLIQMHSPQELRLFIVDLKGGADFRDFRDVPHLGDKTVRSIYDLEALMPRIKLLMQSRAMQFFGSGAKNIVEYNKRVVEAKRMPRVVVIIDECASIDNQARAEGKPEMAKQIWSNMTLIAEQARAAGIHLLLGTQQVYSGSIKREVASNVTFQLSGWQRTTSAAMATDGKMQSRRMRRIPGRMILDNGIRTFPIQTPFVTNEEVHKAVLAAKEYGPYEPMDLPTAEDLDGDGVPDDYNPHEAIIEVAMKQLDGLMSANKIHEIVSEMYPRDEVRKIVKEIVEIGYFAYEGQEYQLGRRGRSWYAVLVPSVQATSVKREGEV